MTEAGKANRISPERLGQLLSVDLGKSRCRFQSLPQESVRYLGGRGINVWYLVNHLEKGTRPLSPENILMFSCGLLTGSSAPASARLHINALSPLTHILGSSNIGGYVGPWLRSCNVSTLAVTGACATPSLLYISPSSAVIQDAADLWGLDALETQDRIAARYPDKRLQVLTIGRGGENQVRFAAVIAGRDHAAGRTGMGAVMGAKKLKAIVIEKGSHTHFKMATSRQKEAVRSYAAAIKASPEFLPFSTHGGAGYVAWVNAFGIMGVKNYTGVGIRDIEKIDGRLLEDKVVKKSGCARCPVQCKADLVLDSEKGEVFTRPEFEPMINLGPKCGLDDLDEIVKLDNLCNRFGLDIISTASVISFAMALAEKGMLDPEQTCGLDLSWGNARTMETLIRQMVAGQGLGRILSQGVRRAARILGRGARELAVHVKGLELTAYHPGTIMGTALGYAVSSRGGDYNNVYASLEYSWTEDEAMAQFGTREAVNIKSTQAKGLVLKKAVTTNAVVDALGLCKVPVLSLLRSFNLEREAKLVEDLTGLRISPRELARTGSDIAAMERLFNITHSQEPVVDRLPDLFFEQGEVPIDREAFQEMLAQFYAAMGWDSNGVPKAAGPPVPSD